MLEIKNLTISYGDFKAVDGLDFSVDTGRWLMLVGPNGAGKSTVLGAIAQSVNYTGEIILDGQNLHKMKAAERASNIGILTQNHYVGYGFSVEEIVRMGLYSRKKGFFTGTDENTHNEVEEALEITGMTALRNQSVLTLSGGELQRAFLAQVLVQNPKVLLLDEPANHLDLIYQKQIFFLIKEWLKKPGRTVISVVHDLSLARNFGTCAVLMNHGKAVTEGNIGDVMNPECLNGVYGMDVGEWMRELMSVWK